MERVCWLLLFFVLQSSAVESVGTLGSDSRPRRHATAMDIVDSSSGNKSAIVPAEEFLTTTAATSAASIAPVKNITAKVKTAGSTATETTTTAKAKTADSMDQEETVAVKVTTSTAKPLAARIPSQPVLANLASTLQPAADVSTKANLKTAYPAATTPVPEASTTKYGSIVHSTHTTTTAAVTTASANPPNRQSTTVTRTTTTMEAGTDQVPVKIPKSTTILPKTKQSASSFEVQPLFQTPTSSSPTKSANKNGQKGSSRSELNKNEVLVTTTANTATKKKSLFAISYDSSEYGADADLKDLETSPRRLPTSTKESAASSNPPSQTPTVSDYKTLNKENEKSTSATRNAAFFLPIIGVGIVILGVSSSLAAVVYKITKNRRAQQSSRQDEEKEMTPVCPLLDPKTPHL